MVFGLNYLKSINIHAYIQFPGFKCLSMSKISRLYKKLESIVKVSNFMSHTLLILSGLTLQT